MHRAGYFYFFEDTRETGLFESIRVGRAETRNNRSRSVQADCRQRNERYDVANLLPWNAGTGRYERAFSPKPLNFLGL